MNRIHFINKSFVNKIGRRHALRVLLDFAYDHALKECQTLLDVGCGDGTKTLELAQRLGIDFDRIVGVEVNQQYAEKATKDFRVHVLDIEQERLPLPENSMELVICNQVLEHIKNVHVVISEINRVLCLDGYAIIGVPNLASLHHRLLLLIGHQPTCIKTMSEHVRAFTFREMKHFLKVAGFEVIRERGAGFYPLSTPFCIDLATRLFPGLSVYAYLLVRKKRHIDKELLQYYSKLGDTSYAGKS